MARPHFWLLPTALLPTALLPTALLPTALLLSFAAVSTARADIRSPQSHSAVELQPHLVLQWADEPGWDDDGIGLGFHAGIPLIPRGPVTSIDNSLVLGIGLDWAHFDDNCGPWGLNAGDNCSADDFWFPIYVQWNFYFSDLISAFPELGLAIEYEKWDGVVCGGNNNAYWCGGDDSDIDVEPVLWLGVRFHLASSFALTIKLGTPSLLLGASFFL